MLVSHRYLRLIGAASAVSAAVAAHPNATNFSAGADFVREQKPKSSKHAKNSKKSSHDAKTSKKKKKTEKSKSAYIPPPPNTKSNDVDKCPIFTENPKNNPQLQEKMFKATKPCGYYENQGCKHPVIPANLVHPGEGPGDLEFIPYIVQFDIGTHPNLKERVNHSFWNYGGKDRRDSIGWHKEVEECLEIIVTGNSAATGGCAGKCGSGCDVTGGGWAKDCLKHDVCTTWKAMYQIRNNIPFGQGDGFCIDPDCGDEAASTIHNCFIDDWGTDTPITCEKSNFKNRYAYGHWSHSTIAFSEGPCNNFIGWNNGQGIPDKNEIDNPY